MSNGFIAPILNREEVAAWAAERRAAGRIIVFTNGCFDLIHFGHVDSLAEAAGLGDDLLVAINSDSSVRELKGTGRPVVSENDRAGVLGALRPVAVVTIFPELTPLETILAVKPDILVKGAEYGDAEIVGASEIRSWGGRVERLAMRPGRSTTSLIAEIRRLPRD